MKYFVRIRIWCCLLSTLTLIFINSVKGSNEEFGDFLTEDLSVATDGPYSADDDVSLRTFREDIVKQNLVFHYFKDGNKTSEDIGLDGNLTDSGCSSTDKFTFIIHGWGQSCEVEWIPRLRDKLTERRGGCIVCIDYGYYKSDSYLRLLRFFRPMTNVITSKLLELKSQGFNPSTAFMFGFSLGGQMATAIGRQFRYPIIKQIDTCDMAGPGFDFRKVFDHRGAAEQVNCWHTSRNKGTRFYSCHQNVRFGNCGHNQPAESPLITSHGLCVLYYINAFDYPFYVTPPPARCMSRNPALFIPNNYTVGYDENKSYLSGEVFVPTSNAFPYNLSLEQIRNILIRGSKPLRFHRRRFPVLIQNARNSIRRRFVNNS